MNNQEKQLKDLNDTVNFIKDNAASKQDLVDLEERMEQRMTSKQDLQTGLNSLEQRMDKKMDEKLTGFKSDIITHIDSFVQLHQKVDTEQAALSSAHQRLEGRVAKLEDQAANTGA